MKNQLPATTHPTFGVALGVIPFERLYVVVPGRFLAGLYPSSDKPHEATEKLNRLLAVGVRHVVNLTESKEKNGNGLALVDYEPELTALAGKALVVCRRFPIVTSTCLRWRQCRRS